MRSLHTWPRASVAVSLILVLLAPPAYARGKPKIYTWSQAQSLKPGTAIMLTVAGSAPVKVELWSVADTTLVTSTPTPPKLPRRVRTVLAEMGANWARVMKGEEFLDGSIRIAREGVFDGTKKLAELTQVVQITPRDRVATIQEVPHSHVLRNVIIVGVVGFIAFVALVAIITQGGGTT